MIPLRENFPSSTEAYLVPSRKSVIKLFVVNDSYKEFPS